MGAVLEVYEVQNSIEVWEAEQVVVEVHTDGQDGHGLPLGGTTGQVPVKLSDDDWDIEWADPSGGGSFPDELSGEVNGPPDALEVATTHSGSSHAQIQAAAEATSDAALSTHASDTTFIHGIPNTALLETLTGAQAKADGAVTAHVGTADPHTQYAKEADLGTTVATDLDVDGTLAANSDIRVPSQKAVVTYVLARIAALVASSPGALDTLDELAAALGDDPNFATTLTTLIGTKVAKASNLSDLASAATARDNLGVEIGSDVQAHDGDLDTIAALNPTDDDVVQRKSGAWVARSMAQIKTDLVLAKGDVGLGNVDNISDANKPVSTAQAAADTAVANASIAKALVDAKGDLIVATGADTVDRVAVGAFGTVPKADSAETTGVIFGQARSLAERYLAPTGAYESVSRAGTGDQSILASGTVTLVAIALPKNFLVTSIAFFAGAIAAVTPTHYWFSLCNSSFVTLRSTADQLTVAWGANTQKKVNLSSTFTTTYEGVHYIAIMVTAGTVPSLSTLTLNGPIIAPFLSIGGLTAQTTAPADATNLAPSPSGRLTMPYAYVS